MLIPILGLVIELLIKLPDIIKIIQEIVAKFQNHLGPVAEVEEAKKLHAALLAVKAHTDHPSFSGVQADALAPLTDYAADLDKRLASLVA